MGPIFQRYLTAFLTAAMLLAQVPAGLLPGVFAPVALAAPVLDQEQATAVESELAVVDEELVVAQTLTVGITGRVARVEVPIDCPDTQNARLLLAIARNNGSLPGPDDITWVAATGSGVNGTATEWWGFTWPASDNALVRAGDRISLQASVIEVDQTPENVTCSWYMGPEGESYAAGSSYRMTTPGDFLSWQGLSEARDDLPFRVFIEPAIDLSLAYTGPGETVTVGDTFSYTYDVTNLGSVAATNVVLNDKVSTGLRFVSWSGSPFSCQLPDEQHLTCTYDSLGTKTTGIITVQVEALAAGVYTTAPGVSADETDGWPANNTASVVTTVVAPPAAEPDLVVTSVEAPTSVPSGGRLSYSWVVANQGDATANTLPSPTPGWADQAWLSTSSTSIAGAYPAGGIVAPNSLAPDGSYFRSFASDIDAPPGNYWLIIQTDSNSQLAESDETNNLSAAVPVTVGSPPPAPVTVSAEVREDTNGDGDFDTGEPFLTVPRIEVYRTNVDGVRAEVPSATALSSPNLSLSGVEAGTFEIEYELPTGYESVSENPVSVSVEAGGTSSTVFVARRIGGLTGIAQCGDVMLPGATVELLSGSALLATMIANEDAFYSFGVAAGATYTIRITGSIWLPPPPDFEFGDEQFFTCGVEVTTGADGSATAPSGSTIPNRLNHTWTTAYDVTNNGVAGAYTASLTDYVFTEGQTTWFKFPVRQGQHVTVNVTDLPADYSVTLYKDIRKLYLQQQALLSGDPLANVDIIDGSVAPDAMSPDAMSPDAMSPDAMSPDAMSPDAMSPDAMSPDAMSPDAMSPDAMSPDAMSPDAMSPDAMSPDAMSPDAMSPEVYASAQVAALIGVSAHVGLSPERIARNTWGNDGYFYVRVRGNNGVFNAAAPFKLTVTTVDSACAGVVLPTFPTLATNGFSGTKTVILTNSARLGSDGAFAQKLADLATHSRVQGVVVDLAGVADAAYGQWDAAKLCPAAANVIAQGIRGLVTAYRAQYPTIEHVVLVGGDNVIPFFRQPDQSGLGNERDYAPPVADDSASQASLKLGYVLTQDPYAAGAPFSRFDHELYVAELGVGRLVETPAQIVPVIDAFLASGGIITPQSALVTGYDFLSDAAFAIAADLVAGGLSTDQDLIQPVGDTSLDPTAWSADQLRAKLLRGPASQIVTLNGHFSANRALAADYSTRFGSEEIAAVSDGRFRNTLVLSTGCHSGYNIVDGHAVPLTQPLDFPQAFALQGATLVGGTGFQYGDTDFIKYSELIHTYLVREMRYGQGPVSIGTALANAKRAYLSELAALRGIDEKAVAEATLYGLPMTAVDLPVQGLARPGAPLGGPVTTLSDTLASATWTPTYTLDRNEVTLTELDGSGTVTAVYYDINGNVSVSPATPVLPLLTQNVERDGAAARGVVLLGASYQDEAGVLPFTDVATTEVRGAHPRYFAEVFTPVRPFSLNHFAGTTLVATPFQFRSEGATGTGTARTITAPQFKIYYSSATTAAEILAGSPVLYAVHLTPVGGGVEVEVIAGASDAVGIEEIFVTYTGASGSLHGTWASRVMAPGLATTLPLASGSVSTYSYLVPTSEPNDLRVIVQAVGGNGLVTWASNNGAYYRVVDETATTAAPKAATEIVLSAPSSGTYLGTASVSAVLTSVGAPLAGKSVAFRSGDARVDVMTDANGRAAAAMPLTAAPGLAAVSVGFEEDAEYLAAGAEDTISVGRARTSFTRVSTLPIRQGSGAIVAILRTPAGPLREQPITISAGGHKIASFSDGYGRVRFDTTDGFPVGNYHVTVEYSGNDRYAAASPFSFPVHVRAPSVKGGGWIDTDGRKSNFSVHAGFGPAGTPDGKLELHARDVNGRFRATSVTRLDADAGIATIHGVGAWNGVEGHTFRALLTDGAVDRFEIWIMHGTAVVYSAAADLGGGSVTVR